jgi:hypothetical protein
MDIWVTYLNAINTHEAMNLARSAAARELAREATRADMAVTGMKDPDIGSNITPTDSTWVWVFALSLFTFVQDMAGLKTPGRPVRRQEVEIDSDDMTDNDISGFKEIEVLDPEPTKELASLRPDLIPGWNKLMALNWNKVRANLQFLGKVVTDCKEVNQEGLGFVDQESGVVVHSQ